MKTFQHNVRYVLSFLVLFWLFSFIQWTENSVSFGPVTAEAKITEETIPPEENAGLDKSDPHIKKVMDIQNRHTSRLLHKPEVVGTATGLTEDNKPAILVFTKKAVEAGVIPKNLEGIPVVVKVTGEIFSLKQPSPNTTIKPTSKFPRPVPIGVSTGNEKECSSGTIGARLKDTFGNVYALSNNHVYARENAASPGEKVLQPGRYDTRCVYDSRNIIGSLYNYVPINFAVCPSSGSVFTGSDNIVDAAIAISSTDNLDNSTPDNGYGTPRSSIIDAGLNQAVQKYGRTTSLTRGSIVGINATVIVNYGPSGCARFTDQILVSSSSPFIKAGDSGSLLVIYDPNDSDLNLNVRRPVGLLFAGNSNGKYAWANPIGEVLKNLGIDRCSNCETVPGLYIDDAP
ncbi:MAG: hypothetical protein WA126_06685 [Thermodesulfovibrionales bacterium]